MHSHRHNLAAWSALAIAVSWTSSHARSGEPIASAERAAIRQRAMDYLAAIRRGDGEEVASFWTAAGDYIDDAGNVFQGRRLALERKPPSDEEDDEGRLSPTIESIRLVAPNVAVEDGALRISPAPASGPVVKRYTAIWLKQDDKWQLDGVRESAVRRDSRGDRLSDLNWMIGDWVSDDEDNTVRLACTRSSNKHFLLREIEIRLPERAPLHVTQRIGWDAHEKQIKSWTFDSEGGHGDGLWFRKGDHWIVEAASVLPDGRLATGANIYTSDGDDAFDWESNNAEIDGEPMPARKLRMVRVVRKKVDN